MQIEEFLIKYILNKRNPLSTTASILSAVQVRGMWGVGCGVWGGLECVGAGVCECWIWLLRIACWLRALVVLKS